MDLSRHEGEFTAAEAARIEAGELEMLLGARGSTTVSRSAAIAAFLSAEGGWQAAGKALRGAFNDGAAGAAWLSDGKEA